MSASHFSKHVAYSFPSPLIECLFSIFDFSLRRTFRPSTLLPSSLNPCDIFVHDSVPCTLGHARAIYRPDFVERGSWNDARKHL
jgi:hypothetical protein